MKRSRESEEPLDGPCSSPVDAVSPPTPLPAAKIAQLAGPAAPNAPVTMKCSLPPHKEILSFTSYDEFDAHYISAHCNRCLECDQNFPSDHFLSLHIEECHDMLNVVRREKGEHTYSCFVEVCERKCKTPQKRRLHLIDKHMYPKNFFFSITKTGIDGRRSLLIESGHSRRRSSTSSNMNVASRRAGTVDIVISTDSTVMEEDGGESPMKIVSTVEEKPDPEQLVSSSNAPVDTKMNDLAEAMSCLHFVPSSIRFGRDGFRQLLAGQTRVSPEGVHVQAAIFFLSELRAAALERPVTKFT